MTLLKYLLCFSLFLSLNAFSASIEIKKGNFGIRFENEIKSNEFIISNITPFATCSTTFTNHLGQEETYTNAGSFKHINYPERFTARNEESHYFQMVINKQERLESPKKTFYHIQGCKFGVSFDVGQIDIFKTILKSGTITAILHETNREVADVIAELNATAPMKFFIRESWGSIVEFHFSGGGVYSF